MPGFEQQLAKAKTVIERRNAGSPIVEKAAEATKKNPTAAAFNVWHANSDIGVGSDNPWGTQ